MVRHALKISTIQHKQHVRITVKKFLLRDFEHLNSFSGNTRMFSTTIYMFEVNSRKKTVAADITLL